jgi:hypothetical protein
LKKETEDRKQNKRDKKFGTKEIGN